MIEAGSPALLTDKYELTMLSAALMAVPPALAQPAAVHEHARAHEHLAAVLQQPRPRERVRLRLRLVRAQVLDLLRREERRDGARVLPPRLEAVELRHDGVLGLEVAADEGMGRHGRVGRACV